MNNACLHDRMRPQVADHLGQPIETVADHNERVFDAAVA